MTLKLGETYEKLNMRPTESKGSPEVRAVGGEKMPLNEREDGFEDKKNEQPASSVDLNDTVKKGVSEVTDTFESNIQYPQITPDFEKLIASFEKTHSTSATANAVKTLKNQIPSTIN